MIDFNYDPMSEEEAERARYKMMEDGMYKGVIEHAISKTFNSGNPGGVFTVRVWDRDGSPKEIIDNVTLLPSMMWKWRHLSAACGLLKEFEEKKFRPELCEGKDVMVSIKTQVGKEIPFDKLNGKPPGSTYPTKNVIEDYVVTAHVANNNDSKGHADLQFDNDMDLPF